MNHSSQRYHVANLWLACLVLLPVVIIAARAQTQTGASAPPAQTQMPAPVKLTVTVTDVRGRYVSGLAQDAFSIYEGKETRAITSFSAADTPASVLILFDMSGSVRGWLWGDRRAAIKEAVLRFVQQGHPDNEYLLGEFGNNARTLTDWTHDPAALTGALDRLDDKQTQKDMGKQTALYDACADAIERLAQRSQSKRVLLLISDGGSDNASHIGFRDLQQKLQNSDVMVYALTVTSDNIVAELSVSGQAVLNELTATTGGLSLMPNGRKETATAAERIAVELRHQYIIGFTPADTAVIGRWNKIRIKVVPPDKQVKNLYVRTRSGYIIRPPA